MSVIYTISHPVTNDIFYVGFSNYFVKRARNHLQCETHYPLSQYIWELKINGIIPKIEIIDECDPQDGLYYERYWVHQIRSWGFTLFNNYKQIHIPSKKPKEKEYFINRHVNKRKKTANSEMPPSFYKEFGERVRLYMKKASLTPSDMSILLNVPSGHVYRIQSGKYSLSIHLLPLLCKLLSVSIIDLMPDYGDHISILGQLKLAKTEKTLGIIEESFKGK